MPDFRTRSTDLEIMDDLNCHGEVVDQTLREIGFINRWLGGNAITLEAVQSGIGSSVGEFTIADLGCGGGDMLVRIAQWGRTAKRKLKLTGFDANPHIIAFARKSCEAYPEISFETIDVLSPEFRDRHFDLVLGTLFFHHLETEKLIIFLSQLQKQVRKGIIINDLHRHWFAYHSIRLLTKAFSKSGMVQYDAPLSVLRAFSRKEWIDILRRAGIRNYQLQWRWAFRWRLIIEGSSEVTDRKQGS